jgi:hypothetical protein
MKDLFKLDLSFNHKITLNHIKYAYMNVFIWCSFILMVLKLRPLTCVNFEYKVQIVCAHVKGCGLVINLL